MYFLKYMCSNKENDHQTSNCNYGRLSYRIFNHVHLRGFFRGIKKNLVAFYVNQTRIPASLLFTLQNLKVPPRSSKLTGFLLLRLFIHEEIYIIQDLAENMITRAKFKRSINLEVNKTEFWSVNSE